MSAVQLCNIEDFDKLTFGKAPQSEVNLGDRLVEADVISRRQLLKAVDYQQENKLSLIETLNNLGLVEKDNQPAFIASRLGIPTVSIGDIDINPQVLAAIPYKMAIRYRVFPLAFFNDQLVVAIANPSNLEAMHALTFAAGNVEIVVASDSDISKLIEKYFLVAEEQAVLDEIDEHPDDDLQLLADNDSQQLIEEKAKQRPVVKLVDTLLRQAVRLGVSDINIRPTEFGADVYYRIDGKMHLQQHLGRHILAPIICRLKILSGMNIAERRLPQDGHASIVHLGAAIDFRVSVIPMVTGESVVVRVLDKSKGLIDLDGLGLPSSEISRLRRILTHNFGIFLVTGPTGSGKTTTLYAVVNERKKNEPHIITVEDPVEYRIDGIEQIQIKPNIGYTFAEALRHILRHDPDEILIGEMRDFETAEIAIKASLTGHFVMSTLHTNDAASSVTRLLDMGIEPYLINSTLVGILAQRLIRKICPDCKVEDKGSQEIRKYFQLDDSSTFYRGAGCSECNQSGYRGRIMVGELVEVTSELKTLISQRASAEQLRQQSVADGMMPLTQNALSMAAQGVCSLEDVFAVKLE
ncbi:MAG: type II/IV secretion system protein [Gammaproteobacteria bacterium]|nr:type II/IV secretion system protein [Gammaproteobacteria bacterium]MBQ0841025.1 type II/IV secretion system protein [Gammaproteobacteria bacterium]